MQEPANGTNIHTIWNKVLTDQPLSWAQIKVKIEKHFKNIPPASFHVHVNDLVRRGFAAKETLADGQTGFRSIKQPAQQDLLPTKAPPRGFKKNSSPQNLLILNFLKKHIGKSFSAGEVKEKLKMNNSSAWDIMKTFAINGLVQREKQGKKTFYLVLPAILDCSYPPFTYNKTNKAKKKTKREIIQAPVEHIEQTVLIHEPIQEHNMPNILDMSVGQLGAYITTLRDENIKLKHTIETMVHMAIQSGVVEQE